MRVHILAAVYKYVMEGSTETVNTHAHSHSRAKKHSRARCQKHPTGSPYQYLHPLKGSIKLDTKVRMAAAFLVSSASPPVCSPPPQCSECFKALANSSLPVVSMMLQVKISHQQAIKFFSLKHPAAQQPSVLDQQVFSSFFFFQDSGTRTYSSFNGIYLHAECTWDMV